MLPPPVHGDPYLCSLWISIAPQAPPARPPGYHADPQVDVALTISQIRLFDRFFIFMSKSPTVQ
ncbi:hypothetical protein SCHPADRAFT_907820 [Schizopora paradoxa]|uniref:Uncharacterized protein n=1 Tax=Schizopora paradoxa TaxID=27342 RepID=A0A0H2RIV8_9AGAM|nr:hypothetical protein SCHPADRAFT_907820 [Schizopora paradoxa]